MSFPVISAMHSRAILSNHVLTATQTKCMAAGPIPALSMDGFDDVSKVPDAFAIDVEGEEPSGTSQTYPDHVG